MIQTLNDAKYILTYCYLIHRCSQPHHD